MIIGPMKNGIWRTNDVLFLSHFATNQLAGIIVILNDIDGTALFRIALDDCEPAASEFLDGFRLAVKIIVVDLADQNPVRIFLDEVNLAIKIPIAFNLYDLVVFVGFNQVGVPITVGVDSELVGVLTNPIYPLVGTPAMIAVRD